MNKLDINRILLTAIFGFSALVTHGQTTLNQSTDPKKQGIIESITFEYPDLAARVAAGTTPPKVRKEFNIQENNPYNKLSYATKGISRSGSKVYSIPTVQSQTAANLTPALKATASNYSDLSASSYASVVQSGDYVVVGYELGFSGEGESLEEGRRSTLIVLDGAGNEVFKIDDQESDFYHAAISDNGKYLAFASGEHLEHSSLSNTPQIKVYDIQTGTVYFEIEESSNGIDFYMGLITISLAYNDHFELFIMDQYTSSIYKTSYKKRGGFKIAGYGKFVVAGQHITFKNLNKVK